MKQQGFTSYVFNQPLEPGRFYAVVDGDSITKYLAMPRAELFAFEILLNGTIHGIRTRWKREVRDGDSGFEPVPGEEGIMFIDSPVWESFFPEGPYTNAPIIERPEIDSGNVFVSDDKINLPPREDWGRDRGTTGILDSALNRVHE